MSANLTAMILAGRKLWYAWLIGVGAEMMWIAYGYATAQWGFAFFGFIFGAVYLRNAHKWRTIHKEHDGQVVV